MRAKAGGGAVILAGDIGGTRTRLALFERAGEALSPVWRTAVLNEGHASLAALLTSVGALAGVEVEAACFGVAGPVEDGVCRMTNLDWRIDEAEIGGMGPVRLVNDLSAIALGVAHLPDAGFAVLQEGTRRWGGAGMAVVAPGTGLGEAGLLWDGRRHLVIASEAGHADFAPAGELEIELYRFLRRRHGHVSYEHVASGPGLAMLAAFLTEARGTALPEALATCS
jgi:glucokinase